MSYELLVMSHLFIQFKTYNLQLLTYNLQLIPHN